MTNVLQWRKTTWVLLLWGGYVPAWAVITGSGPAIVALWWLAGAIVFGVLWLGTQLLSRQGRGFSGIFSWPGWTNWRVVDLRRARQERQRERVDRQLRIDSRRRARCEHVGSASRAARHDLEALTALLCVQVRAGARRAVCR